MKSNVVSRWIALAAVAYAVAGVSLFGQSAAKSNRSFVAGRFALILDGNIMGYVKGIEGGEISADVLNLKGGASTEDKHIGQPRYGDVFLEMGIGLEPAFYDWISDTWARKSPRKSGAISTLSFDNKEITRTEFFNALITETVIPSCDAADRVAGYLTLRLTPESTKMVKGSGGPPSTSLSQAPVRPGLRAPLSGARSSAASPASSGNLNREAKPWLTSFFRLQIDKIDTSRVAKIDSFSVKQGIGEEARGGDRFAVRQPGRVEYPNLVLYIPEPFAQPWRDWFEDFVIRGNNGPSQERTGTLDFLAPNLQTVLLTVSFKGLGICKISPANGEASREQVRRVKVELYCEEMSLKMGK